MPRLNAPPPRALNSIPADILHLIGSYTDSRTRWAMKTTCRGWRDPADGALAPFLREKQVTVDPPLMIDSYTAIDALPPKQYTARKRKLLARHKQFVRHLEAYPASGSQLQSLTVEIRDDDGDAGWRIMEEFASQLGPLEIHIFDRYFTPESVEMKKRVAEYRDKGKVDADNKLSWARLVDSESSLPNQLPLLSSLTIHSTARTMYHLNHIADYLPNLRSLTLGQHWRDDYIHLTSNLEGPAFQKLERLSVIGSMRWIKTILCGIPTKSTGAHIGGPPKRNLLARSPNLRSLTIHWRDSDRGSNDGPVTGAWDLDSIMGHIAAPRWLEPKQARSGDTRKSGRVEKAYGAGRYEEEGGEVDERDGEESEDDEEAGDKESDHGVPIRKLAIFGPDAQVVMGAMSKTQKDSPWAFQCLTDLLLEPADTTRDTASLMRNEDGNRYLNDGEESDAEESDGTDDESDDWIGDEDGEEDEDEDEDDGQDEDEDDGQDEDESKDKTGGRFYAAGLPALERITWIYRPRPQSSSGSVEGEGDEVTTTGYDEDGLRQLLDRYPSLQEASCISNYPADPFAPIHASDPNVICSVRRGA